jgi:signal transduction histidine kinase
VTRAWVLAAAAIAFAIALVAVGWFDFVSARREFNVLVRAQASSVRDTIAAAARANRTAGEEAQAELAARLLDNARLLAELDRRTQLSPAFLDDIARRNHLFRLTIFAPDGSREQNTGVPAGPGRGQGGPGWFAGAGMGAGPGAGAMIDRLIKGGEQEAVTDLHAGRRTGAARLAAGVRRGNGGAIVISVDATEVLKLQQQSSLDRLLDDIVGSTADVAYLVFEQGDIRRARGEVAIEPDVNTTSGHDGRASSEREVVVAGRPVLELTGPIELGGDSVAHVHLGMRLDGVRRAERRTLARLATSLTAAALLGPLAISLVWLYQRYGTLSVEHARAQEALRRRDRLAAMGELASTVAHEIRNPLNAIAMSAQRLRRECLEQADATSPADRDEALALVDVVQGEAQRINGKVQQFLEFARPPALAPRAVELSPWLATIADSIGPYATARQVAFTRERPANAEVVIDPEQLRQALDNLLRNAVEATPPGGTVSLAGRVTSRELFLEVRDTGSGIARDDLPRIFDLYFTTKRDGTGVGLAVTQQIVAAHGGRIDVDSSPGHGTLMRVVIPLSLAPSTSHA